ncbi:hypothetical protein BY996DRAFT_7730494 [Phakopsora pachyrhizi]|uniref:Protein BFR2 n=1 Tax=Phakopsora pachyrhizi TaxID=170000 RepID=A0AAV0B6F1_PHAPC|nr:hypothetical protein BY996DRAFT_7730494 [Phakopsora pachyrhizi]CAH7680089.1 expressed protein [Phakopsora pachyrhizi]
MASNSLKRLFEQINRPNPTELDPEDDYHSIQGQRPREASTSSFDQPDGSGGHREGVIDRDGLVDVGPSEMRIKLGLDSNLTELEQKYPTRPISLKQWTENNSQDEEEAEREREDKSDDSNVVKEDPDSDSDEEDDKLRKNGTTSSSSSQKSKDEEEETERVEKSLRLNKELNENHNNVNSGETHETLRESKSDLINQLRTSVKSELVKAQAVKSQLAVYDRLISLRIGIQKTLVLTNKFLLQNEERENLIEIEGDLKEHNQEEERKLIGHKLLLLSSKIGKWRETFMSELPISQDDREGDRKEFSTNGFEVEGINDDDLVDCLRGTDTLDHRLEPYLKRTIQKWFHKIDSTNLLQQTRSNRTERTDPIRHLQSIWSDQEQRRKLIERTQLLSDQSSDQKRKRGSEETVKEKTLLRVIDKNQFDDQEFYKSILKQVVENNQDLIEGGLNENDYRSKRTRRIEKTSDRRSTKSRKLNFEQHPKLKSFMVPVLNEIQDGSEWMDERKDELFGSLFGIGS